MKGVHQLGAIVLTLLTLWGCSGTQSPSRANWTAQPAFHEVENQLVNARLTPLKGDHPFFAAFTLSLTNKSDADLIVDWNASQYLFNGRPQGVLVFEGIDPETIKAATVPTETIAPGETFTRDVMPLRLIAWRPIGESSPGSPGIRPGMIPAGRNGIRLALDHAKGRMTIPLSVTIANHVQP